MLQSTCAKLLQRVRDADTAQAAAAPGAKPVKRGVAPGSFLHHLAHAKHHHSVQNGDALSDTEVIQQVRGSAVSSGSGSWCSTPCNNHAADTTAARNAGLVDDRPCENMLRGSSYEQWLPVVAIRRP